MKKYTYEVSVWTLQDEFITILKRSNVDSLGQIEDGELTIKDDGTEELTFSIPMYIYNGLSRVVNPIWHSTMNGDIIANMRKIKVIFNKNTDVARCFEFLIIDTEESHSNDVLACTVKCEGLAFHELGKIGYKISLSSDAFYNEDYEWYAGTARYDEENPEPEPRATLQYWNNKFLTPYPEDGVLDPRTWYYVVDMDWGAYADGDNRDSSIVYEEAYTSSWQLNNGQLIPSGTISYKEKERLVDLEESNIYNITLELAETFGVFCRYEYVYDENYYIIGKVVHYYNNYFKEDEGYLDLTYPYSTSAITRHKDGTDITTKMFVRPVDSDSTDSGWITIIDVPANKSGEDYILNFDYLYSIKAITDELYAAIPEYEYHMAECNNHMRVLDNILLTLRNELPELEAKVTTTTNSIREDLERITASDDLLNMLIYKDISSNTSLTVDEKNPYTGILLKSKDRAEEGTYYVKITDAGVLPETVRVFHTYNFGSHHLDDPMNGGIPEYDEFGNLVAMKGYQVEENDLKTVYLTYLYIPHLLYERVKNTWLNRLAKDEADLSDYTERLNTLRNKIDQYQQEYDTWYDLKEEYKTKFERMMGPALRESYWQPEDYKDCGDRHMDDMEITNVPLGPTDDYSRGESGYTLFMWDTERFEEEDKLTYNFSVNEEEHMYPYVELSDPNLLEFVKDHLDTVSFLWYDYNLETGESYEPRNIRAFTAGSLAQYGFVLSDGLIVPALILTGALDLSDISLANMASESHCPLLGVIHTNIPEGNETALTVTIEAACDPSTGQFINLAGNNGVLKTEANTLSIPLMFYPRIKIGSLAVRTNDEELSVMLNNDLLTNYADYYVLSRYIEHTIDEEIIPDFAYYVTLKPRTLLAHTYLDDNDTTQIGGALSFRFTLSNADTAIYLDALPVLKENAYPRVSYDIDPSVVDTAFLYTIYNKLNCIVNINDTDLRLENVQGYISSITIDLDLPQNDQIEIKNYKTKFEDLFSSIVAQTEEMKKNSLSIEYAASAFTSTGGLSSTILQGALNSSSLTYSFNDDKLIIDEVNGLVAENDNGGVVSIRNNGIFTANEKDAAGDWIWNTAISPSGISANLLTAGQLDTSKINIYAGDRLRFLLNGDGLYAYKSFFSDLAALTMAFTDSLLIALNGYYSNNTDLVDPRQYVVHNAEGLFLVAKAGAYVVNDEGNGFITIPNDVSRVEVSWNGLILRNYLNKEVFFADPATGNLELTGKITATALTIYKDGTDVPVSITDYINEVAGVTTVTDASQSIEEIITDIDLLSTQTQADNNIVAWFYNGDPTSYTLPTSLWDDKTENNIPIDRIAWHVNDFYYNLTANTLWQFVQDTNNEYVWLQVEDEDKVLSFRQASITSESYDGRIAAYIAPALDPTIHVANLTPDDSDIKWGPGITSFEIGDYWVNTSQNNAVYRYDGTWVLLKDSTFDLLTQSIRNNDLSVVTGLTDSTLTIWFYPSSYDVYENEWGEDFVRHNNDIWYQTDTHLLKEFLVSSTNLGISVNWVTLNNDVLSEACAKLVNTPYTKDSCVNIFADSELLLTNTTTGNKDETLIMNNLALIPAEGDYWINLNRDNLMYLYINISKNQYLWQQVTDNVQDNLVIIGKNTDVGKKTIFFLTTALGNASYDGINTVQNHDLWYNLDNYDAENHNASNIRIYEYIADQYDGVSTKWNSSASWWNDITTYNVLRALANLMIGVAVEDNCVVIYTANASNPDLLLEYLTPSLPATNRPLIREGDFWINTSHDDMLYRYLNNSWNLYEEPILSVNNTLPVNTIVRINAQYCLSDSNETLVNATTWTDVIPTYTNGLYLWQRNAITRNTVTSYEPSESGWCVDILTNYNITISADALVFLEPLAGYSGVYLETESENQSQERTEKYITLTALLTNVHVGGWYYEDADGNWLSFDENGPELKVYAASNYNIWVENKAHIKVVSLESDIYYDTITLYIRPMDLRVMENEESACTFVRDEEIVIPVDNNHYTFESATFNIPITSYYGIHHVAPVGALITGSGIVGKISCSVSSSSIEADTALLLTINVAAPVDLSNDSEGDIIFIATLPKLELVKVHWRTLVSASVAGGISITSSKATIESVDDAIELQAHYYFNGEILDSNADVTYLWYAVPGFTSLELELFSEQLSNRSIILPFTSVWGSRTFICSGSYLQKIFTDLIVINNTDYKDTVKVFKYENSNEPNYYYFVAKTYRNSLEWDIVAPYQYTYLWYINDLPIITETISSVDELAFINAINTTQYTTGLNKVIKVNKRYINARAIINCSVTIPDTE